MPFRIFLILLGLIVVSAQSSSSAAFRCGSADDPCRVRLGVYHVAMPEKAHNPDTLYPVVLHLHGLGGSGARVVQNKKFVRVTSARGYVLIAPTALEMPHRPVTNWAVRDGSRPWRDERAFIEELLDDAARKFPIDRSRVLLTGFSRGGSLVWDLACATPREFAAFAPISGGFWRPHPKNCEGPVRLFHTHGWRDNTVPLEGRRIPSRPIHQGDIFQGLQLWREVNGCRGTKPDGFEMTGLFWRRRWTQCENGTALELALHPGGRRIPEGWATMVLDWFEAGNALQ